MEITTIQSIKMEEMESLRSEGKAELLNIKEHNCYFTDLGGNFGYSVLVFKNNHHIEYANDYQLHHITREKAELKQLYIDELNNKLFTESELMEPVYTYDEYKRKKCYVINYWIMQFDHVSAYYIGKPGKELEKAKMEMIYCPTCFCYVSNEDIAKKAYDFIQHINKSFSKAKENMDVFRKMISFELANHEACITCSYRDALYSLGLKFEELTEDQQRIVKEELSKQIEDYM